jgi:hypothetical protein
MSEGEVLVSGGEASESGEDIFLALPPWMPKDETTGNFKLLDVVGRGFDRFKDDLRDVEDAVHPQNAQTIGQLEELAQLVEVESKSGESADKFRKRVIGEFQTTTSEGTVGDLFNNISTLLSVSKKKIQYQEGTENGTLVLSVPGSAIDSVSITKQEFANIIDKHTAAGFRSEIKARGTFTFMTPSDYNNNNHDASKGYDGLDSNSDPKDNGGTYAGLLN